jgi:hypothetical protein
MPETEEVPDLVRRDRFEIEAPGLSRGRDRPGKRGIEEDVGFEQLAAGDVDGVAGRAQRAVEFGPVAEREVGDAVVVGKLAIGHAGPRETNGRRRYRLPRPEGTDDRVVELPRRDPAACTCAHEVGHGLPVRPFEDDRPTRDRVAELEVGRRRHTREHGDQSDQCQQRATIGHRAPPASTSARTSAARSSIRRGTRVTLPRDDGSRDGASTRAVPSGAASARSAPWCRPSTL